MQSFLWNKSIGSWGECSVNIVGAEDMDQSVKYLGTSMRARIRIPRAHVKVRAWWCITMIPTGEAETEGWVPGAYTPERIGISIPKTKVESNWGKPPSLDLWSPYTCAYIHIHRHTHKHVNKKNQKYWQGCYAILINKFSPKENSIFWKV